MKVAIGGFINEVNTFSRETIGLESFQNSTLTKAADLIEKHRGDRRIAGGFIDYAEKHGWEIVPLIVAYAPPAGPIREEAYQEIKKEFLDPIRNQDVDGVLLHLHGAIVSEGMDDCEGDIITSIRNITGTEIPIMLVSDLHANITKTMVESVNGIFGYNTQPHADMYEREQEAAALMDRCFTEKRKTRVLMAQPPLLLPAISTDTSIGAMKPVMEKAYELEKEPDILNVSPFAGFYGSDIYNAGASAVVVVQEGDEEKGRRVAEKMADFFWEQKETFFVETVPLEDAVRKSENEGGLWVFIDEADDPYGGGPADGTYLLQKLINMSPVRAGLAAIHDPEIVEKAFSAGEGNQVVGKLGAKKDFLHGKPVEINAKVRKLHKGRIPLVFWNEEDTQNPGRIAVLEQNGVYIVVTELKTNTESIDVYKYLGIDVTQFLFIIGKGLGEAYQAVYKDLAKGFLTLDSIGITNPNVKKIGEFKKIRRPIYPLDDNVTMRYE